MGPGEPSNMGPLPTYTFICVVLFWLRCVACGILVPWPGIEPLPRQWNRQVLTTGPPGNSPFLCVLIIVYLRHCKISYLVPEFANKSEHESSLFIKISIWNKLSFLQGPWCWTTSGGFSAWYTSERSHHQRCHCDSRSATPTYCEGCSSTKSTDSRHPENTFASTTCTRNLWRICKTFGQCHFLIPNRLPKEVEWQGLGPWCRWQGLPVRYGICPLLLQWMLNYEKSFPFLSMVYCMYVD